MQRVAQYSRNLMYLCCRGHASRRQLITSKSINSVCAKSKLRITRYRYVDLFSRYLRRIKRPRSRHSNLHKYDAILRFRDSTYHVQELPAQKFLCRMRVLLVKQGGSFGRPAFFGENATEKGHQHTRRSRDCPCRPRAPRRTRRVGFRVRVRVRVRVGLVWADVPG